MGIKIRDLQAGMLLVVRNWVCDDQARIVPIGSLCFIVEVRKRQDDARVAELDCQTGAGLITMMIWNLTRAKSIFEIVGW